MSERKKKAFVRRYDHFAYSFMYHGAAYAGRDAVEHFGAGIGILGGFLALFVGTAAAGIGLFAAGIGLLIAGMVQMAIVPLVGVCLVGAGILLIGLALFCIWITIWLWGTVFPWIIRTVVNLCRRLLHGRRGEER